MERATKPTDREKWLRRYGLTEQQYAALVASQGGVCAICKSPQGNALGRALAVDHCHGTYVIRGALCFHCNAAVGHLRDNPSLALAAAEYLQRDLDGAPWGHVPDKWRNPVKGTLPRVKPEEREEVIRLHGQGVGQRDIARQVGRSDDTVWRILRRAGLTKSAGQRDSQG